MGGIIHILYRKRSVFIQKLCHSCIFEDGKNLLRRETKAENFRHQAADCDAVAYHRNALPVVPAGNFQESGIGTVHNIVGGFCPIYFPVAGVMQKYVRFFRKAVRDIPKELSFPRAEIELPQAYILMDRKTFASGNAFRSQNSAGEITGIDGINRNIPETDRKCLNFLHAERSNVPVPVSLHHTVTVAFSLCMADQINLRHSIMSCLDVM